MTPEEAGLLRDVLEAPDDDGPKLILADYWEDHGRPERAEFVRVMAASGKPYGPVDRYHGRLSLLFGERFREWLAPLPRLLGLTRYGRLGNGGGHMGEPAVNWSWRRGFVERVEMPLAAFLAHAAAIFAAHPVTEVRLADMGPDRAYEGYCFHVGADVEFYLKGGVTPAPHIVPYELFSLLPGRAAHAPEGDQGPLLGVKEYDSPEDGMGALSRACVSHGRALAGLPPLPT